MFQPLGGVVYLLAVVLPELVRGPAAQRIGHSAREALDRIERCLSMPGREGSHASLLVHGNSRPEIARVVNLILFFEGDDELPAGRKMREVLLVKGYHPENDQYDVEYV
jgi:hypothetical protein